ncbi:MAG: indole-3-glycerol phosphate synthase TrpC [Alphaproteobacteria bacterium]|nr:indole-3-glycerol phosphate synthase TrpC [Alphaproteobacteria bacterium]
MSDVLERICNDKRQHIEQLKAQRPLSEIVELATKGPTPRGFAARLKENSAQGYGLIAELKKASPSKGLIRPEFAPASLARAYASGGATCLSVLTDIPYFQGKNDYLTAARMATSIPVLRKDFMLDPYQIYESRAIGADCILLIMAALDDETAQALETLAFDLGLDVLIEVHNQAELERALRLKSPLIGVNNRNLKTLDVDLATTEALAKDIPGDRIAVGESGLGSPDDLARCAAVGVRCFLIGESLMRQDDVRAATRAILTSPVAA